MLLQVNAPVIGVSVHSNRLFVFQSSFIHQNGREHIRKRREKILRVIAEIASTRTWIWLSRDLSQVW